MRYRINGKIAELIDSNNGLGLFKFDDGSQFVFSLYSPFTIKIDDGE